MKKTQPAGELSVNNMLSYVVCDDEREPLNVHHPVLTVLGQWFDPIDGVNHAPHMVLGARPKHTFAVLGSDDHYSPPSGNHALVTAAGLWQVAPMLDPVVGQVLRSQISPGAGYAAYAAPAQANVGGTTAGFRQYPNDGCTDGHFVYTCNTSAAADWAAFFTRLSGGVPVVP